LAEHLICTQAVASSVAGKSKENGRILAVYDRGSEGHADGNPNHQKNAGNSDRQELRHNFYLI